MRPVLLALLLGAATLVRAAPLAAAAPPAPFHVLPLGQVQWSGETPAPPSASGLAGRWQAIIVVDWDDGDAKRGQHTWNSYGWNFSENITTEQRVIPIAIAVNGSLPARGEGQPNVVLKGSADAGLLRALVGDSKGAYILVAPDGLVKRLMRHTGDCGSLRTDLQADLALAAPLAADVAGLPAACTPALEMLRVGDVPGALALARKKLGADGASLVGSLQERANAMIIADTTLIGASTTSPAERMLARERLKGLVGDFPSAPAGAAALALLKTRPDAGVQAEMAAWARLQDYFAQMAKASPKKGPALQASLLSALIAACPGTYAADIAGMIKVAARAP
jgi:hypothetical protein